MRPVAYGFPPQMVVAIRKIVRPGLEDHFCRKLLGPPIGVDIRHTNNAHADQDTTLRTNRLILAVRQSGQNGVVFSGARATSKTPEVFTPGGSQD